MQQGVVGAYDIGGHALPPPCTNGLHLVQERLDASAVLPLSMPMSVAQGERMGGPAHGDAIIACVCLESPT